MRLLIVFGLPGSGKTYVSGVIAKSLGYHLYEGDDDMPKDMDETIKKRLVVTEDMRNRFFKNMLQSVRQLVKIHEKMIVSQTFIKERHRKKILDQFPKAHFILVKTRDDIREKRLENRKEYPLERKQARVMCENFDKPEIPYDAINNDEDGEENIREQMKMFLT